jgi:recombination protein RecT
MATAKGQTTQLAKSGGKPSVLATVQDLLKKNQNQLEAALPKHLNADRMIRVVLTALTTQPMLQQCDVPSIAKAVIEAAQLGLEPDGILGYAYLIPFRNTKRNCLEAKMMVGYRGYLALARRSGQLKSLDVDVICEKDRFEYQKGSEPKLTHVPALLGPRGKVIGAYACARLTDGGVQFEVLSLDYIEQIRSSSRAADNGPWATHFEAMAKKTAIRALAKYLPLSVEFQQAAVRDEYTEAGLDVGEIDVTGGDMGGIMASATAAKAEGLKEKYRNDPAPADEGSPGIVDDGPKNDQAPEPGSAG